MKNILLLPFFRFGDSLKAVTIRTIEIYSRINKKDFNFIINVDLNTYNEIDKYYYEKIVNMDKSSGYAGKNIIKLTMGLISTVRNAKRSDYIIDESEYFYNVLYSYLIHILSRKSLIIAIHIVQPDMYRENNYFHYIIYRHIFNKVQKFLILNNKPIIDKFKEIFNSSKIRIFEITNGVNSQLFYTSTKKIYDLIFIGEIAERKNAFMLPDIVENLKRINDNIKLLIISHLGQLDKLKDIVNEKNLNKNIEFVSYVTEEEKREYLAKSKIMVFPTAYEGFGMVIIEAFASSLPVVLFDVPTLKIFNKGVLKATAFNLNEYINNIIYLLKNEKEREKLGREGRDDVLKRFDYDIVAEIENNIIKEAVS